MQILKQKTNFDFVSKRRVAIFASTLINLAIIVGIAIFGLNWGVDFAGGTVVELRFKQPTSAEEVRRRAQAAGLADVSVQQIGGADENSFLLRMGGVTQLTQESADAANAAVQKLGTVQAFRPDLNNGIINLRTETRLDDAQLREAIVSSGMGVSEIRSLGEAQGGGFDYQVVASGMADRVFTAMRAGQAEADFDIMRVDYVGPQVGKQLRNRGIAAVIYAALAILIYVAFRFDFRFGPGALVALVHDLVMVLGYYLVTRREFNLTSIAVLLTIIGYSINDTIVIYDRIRESMVRLKGKPITEIINVAINETLSRTILTSTITALSLIGLIIFGVGEIFDFAAAMMVGLVAGSYSTIFIASPLVIWLDERASRRQASGARSGSGHAPEAGAA